MAVITFLLSALFILVCFFLIFVVLIQKGEGGGLGGLAGGGAVDVAFGAKADMTWKRATGVAAGIFVVLALVLGVLQRPTSAAREAAREAARKAAITPTPLAPTPLQLPTPGANPS